MPVPVLVPVPVQAQAQTQAQERALLPLPRRSPSRPPFSPPVPFAQFMHSNIWDQKLHQQQTRITTTHVVCVYIVARFSGAETNSAEGLVSLLVFQRPLHWRPDCFLGEHTDRSILQTHVGEGYPERRFRDRRLTGAANRKSAFNTGNRHDMHDDN